MQPSAVAVSVFRNLSLAGMEACVPFVTVKAQSAPLCVTANDAGVWQSPLWEQDKKNSRDTLCIPDDGAFNELNHNGFGKLKIQ